jgi:hypothetical protein
VCSLAEREETGEEGACGRADRAGEGGVRTRSIGDCGVSALALKSLGNRRRSTVSL